MGKNCLIMQRDSSQIKSRHGSDFNAHGQQIRRVGTPLEKDDAMTWAAPEYTTAERDAIPSPYRGMIIYNTSTNKLNVYTTTWEAITSA